MLKKKSACLFVADPCRPDRAMVCSYKAVSKRKQFLKVSKNRAGTFQF